MDAPLRAGGPERARQTKLGPSRPPAPQHPQCPEEGPQGEGLLRALEERLGEGQTGPGGPSARMALLRAALCSDSSL
eukprot:117342-Alexandrium_andersonii.AAC.1